MRMTGAYKAPLLQSPPTAKRPYRKLGISDSTRARKNIHRVDRLPQGRFLFHTQPAFTPSWGSMWQSSLHGCIFGGVFRFVLLLVCLIIVFFICTILSYGNYAFPT